MTCTERNYVSRRVREFGAEYLASGASNIAARFSLLAYGRQIVAGVASTGSRSEGKR